MSMLAPRPKVPSAKFTSPGDGVSGKVVYPPEDRQVKDFATQQPKFWPDGNPIMQTKIVLDTAEGYQAIYADGEKAKAIRAALIEAGAPDIEVGGWLKVVHTKAEQGKGAYPKKLYEAEYKAPGPDDEPDPADLTDLDNDGVPF